MDKASFKNDNLNALYDFIDRAQKNRKYLPNVATNFKTPLRLIEKELNEEEKNSINLLKSRLEEIFNIIYSKPNNTLSAASLGIYKRRIQQLIDDYENYGKDPNKMATWNRKIVTRRSKEKETKIVSTENVLDSPTPMTSFDSSELQAADLALTNGKARIIVPKQLSEEDIEILKFQIDILAHKLPTKR